MTKYLIHAMILPMTSPHDFYARGEIAVEGNRIIAVGERGCAPAGFQPDKIINLEGDVVLPGLINTHTHSAMTLLRGYADDMPLMPWLEEKVWPFEDRMTPEDIYWGSSLALCEMIRSGTTTMVDMYINQEETARAILQAGTRALLSRGMIGLDDDAAEKALEDGIILFKKFQGEGEGRIKVLLGPHAPYTCPGEFLQEVKQEADKLGTGINIHVAETRTEIEIIKNKYGVTPIQWLEKIGLFGNQVIAAHCVHVTEEDMEIMREYGLGVAHNAESNMKLNSGTAPVSRMLAKGIPVGIGTDGACSNNDLDMFGEMRSAAFQQKLTDSPESLKAYNVLAMATVEGAKVTGLDDIGMLAPGYKADLISVNLDQPHFYPRFSIPSHLVYCARGGDVRTVMVDGKILMQEGNLLTLDERKICLEAEKRAKRIASEL